MSWMNKIGNKEYALKQIVLLLSLMLPASLSFAAADVELNAEGKKLYQQLVNAAAANDCEMVIITGFQFKQGYSAYLEAHPETNEKTEASIDKCINTLKVQDIPVKPASSLGIAE